MKQSFTNILNQLEDVVRYSREDTALVILADKVSKDKHVHFSTNSINNLCKALKAGYIEVSAENVTPATIQTAQREIYDTIKRLNKELKDPNSTKRNVDKLKQLMHFFTTSSLELEESNQESTNNSPKDHSALIKWVSTNFC